MSPGINKYVALDTAMVFVSVSLAYLHIGHTYKSLFVEYLQQQQYTQMIHSFIMKAYYDGKKLQELLESLYSKSNHKVQYMLTKISTINKSMMHIEIICIFLSILMILHEFLQ